LTDDDLKAIAHFIQIYNAIEFHLRRCVGLFAELGKLPPKAQRRHRKLQTSELAATLKVVVRELHLTLEAPEALVFFDFIEEYRSYRNLFAHWAARRVKDKDVIIFVSRSDSDTVQLLGTHLEYWQAASVLMHVGKIHELIERTQQIEHWLARKTSLWEAVFEEDLPPRSGRKSESTQGNPEVDNAKLLQAIASRFPRLFGRVPRWIRARDKSKN
jgi:hypothetical protein